jgi:hypothetical protein
MLLHKGVPLEPHTLKVGALHCLLGGAGFSAQHVVPC